MARYVEDLSSQTLFVDGSLESLLPLDSVARKIWGALCGLDFSRFDEKYYNDAGGRPAIDPRRLAGVWIVGLLRGVTSSVVLATLCSRDIEMRWMVGDSRVKKSTLSDFRKRHVEELSELSTQILGALARSDMLPGRELAVDGTIVRAASSCSANVSRGRLKKRVKRLEKMIEKKLLESDGDDGLEDLSVKKERFERALSEMSALGLNDDKDRMNVTEPEAKVRKLKKGGFAPAHNVQVTTDLESGAIISANVIDQGNDKGQLLSQVEKAEEALANLREESGGKNGTVRKISADSSYHDTRQLLELEGRNIETYVPDSHSGRRPPGIADAFLVKNFEYDCAADTMICPQGHPMRRLSINAGKTAVTYGAKATTCRACDFKSECCPKTKVGRSVNRPIYGQVLNAIAQRIKSKDGIRCRNARKVTMEGAFARLKELLHWKRCRTWGKQGAYAEALWRQMAHNLMLLIGEWKPLTLKDQVG